MQQISIKTLSELPFAAKVILDFAKEKRIFCFYGELGAGKTTLIKEICKQLGVRDGGSSPTFSLVNEYRIATPTLKEENRSNPKKKNSTAPFMAGGNTIYHLDLYRLKSESEIYDIGYEDYLFSGNYCFIEWPEKMERLLPPDIVKVKIQVKDSERVITVE